MEYTDGEMHPKGNKPSPGPHDSRGGDNSDYDTYAKGEQGPTEPAADAQDFGDGLEKDSGSLDRRPAIHRS